MDIIIPRINSKGVFVFNPPFDKPELNNKEYEVTEIRTMKSLYDSGEDPFKLVYEPNGISLDKFAEDLKKDIPVITLADASENYLYVPANYIREMPPLQGYPATERLITFSLGVVPDDIDLTPLLDNIKTIINDTLSILPSCSETPGSETILMTETDYKKYLDMMKSQSRSENKSYRIRYLEEVEANRLLRLKLQEINKALVDIISKKKKEAQP